MTARPGPTDTELPEDLFEIMVRSSGDGMIAIDHFGRVLFANGAALEMLGTSEERLLGTQFGLPIATDEPFELELLGGGTARVAELRVAVTGDGIHVAMLRDVSQRVRLRNELRRLALADELTGIGNRRSFLTLGSQALKVAAREGWDAILVFLDIDDMKGINDRFGHASGDRAVITVARLLTETVRGTDVVARIGGDEFCVLLTGSATRADGAAEGLHRLEAAAEAVGKRVSFPLAVTLGATVFDHHEPATIEELMQAADAVMYARKRERPRAS